MIADKKKVYLQLWDRHLEIFEEAQLDYKEVGLLVMSMLKYQFHGVLPEKMPKHLTGFWVLLRRDADYTRHRYEVATENGSKGGKRKAQLAKASNSKQNVPLTITETESITKSITESISNTQTDSISVSDEKRAYGEFGWVKLSDQEYQRLLQQLGYEELSRCITYMDEAAQSTNNHRHWKDWALMVRRCHQKRWHEDNQPHVPTGANGELGQAELEAIQQLLMEK